MLPYEILLNFKGTLSTCAQRFANKKNSLKLLNYELHLCTLSSSIQRNNFDLLLNYMNANKNINSFHTHFLVKCQANSNDLKCINVNTAVLQEKGISSNNNNLVKSSKDVENEIISSTKPNNIRDTKTKIPEVVKKWLFSDIEKVPRKDIEKLFREPKVLIHNLYSNVASETKIRNCLSSKSQCVNVSNQKSGWSFTYDVQWPEQKSFCTISHSKASASNSAALKCLYWLHLNKRIVNRLPIVYDKNEIGELINENYELQINEHILKDVIVFLEKNQKNIYDTLLKNRSEGVNRLVIDKETIPRKHPISHITIDFDNRNRIMQHRLTKREQIKKNLPIFDFKSQILNEIEENQALVIKGDTGCGKTTQVPQFIIDYFTEKGKAADCSMIVTQPRRISTISLAQRIAFERNEAIGDVIGYQVRLQQVLPKQKGSILFCTTGVLLKKLQRNLALDGCSHVIIDEAHERNVDTDMLLVLLKRAMQKNSFLKVIVMSATINADLFQEYLGCNSVEVPGRLFPVHMNFLEDIQELGFTISHNITSENDSPIVNCDQITDLITWLSINKPPGAILCFLPGWNHIQKIQQTLLNSFNTNYVVIPLHSKIPYVDQKIIFDPPPDGKRKIILSTDIAETGITVPDVVYVIDSACRKEVRWHENKGLSSIDTHWIAKANVNQRKGRAGRVQQGESYHFLSRVKYEELEEYPVPEVLRVSLEKTVLDTKIFSNEKAEDFLGSMPQPPRLSSVRRAVIDLQFLGALDKEENLTALGKRIALFSIHPKLSKAMVYSSIFQCLNPISSIAASLSSDSEIFYGTLTNKTKIREIKSYFHPTSDHLSVAWIYLQWLSILDSNTRSAYEFCKQNHLYADRMSTLKKICNLNLQHLLEAGLLDNIRDSIRLNSKENKYSSLDELVRGVLLAGMDQVIKQRKFDFRKGRLTKSGTSLVTEDNTKAQFTPECVNYKRKDWPSPFAIYYQKTHHQESRLTFIRESSIISPLTILLFSQGKIIGSKYTKQKENEDKVILRIDGKLNVNIICDRTTAEVLLHFRDLMWSIVRYYIENTKSNWEKNDDVFGEDTIDSYKRDMMNVLTSLLSTSAASIDSANQSVIENVEEEFLR